MKTATRFFLAIIFFGFIHCASDSASSLEDARFALDNDDYTTAINKAQEVIDKEPNNIAARRIQASAYFGRAGLNFLSLAADIMDLQADDDNYFRDIAGVLPSTATTLSDLRLAVETLGAIVGLPTDETVINKNDELADAAFDLALMQAIDHFAIGVYQSNFKTTFTAGNLDVSSISATDASNVMGDLLNFDHQLIASGLEADNAFISTVRQTFCILEPLSAGSGFTQDEFQALVGCQLDPTNFNPATVSGAVANCAAILPSLVANQTCFDQNTTL